VAARQVGEEVGHVGARGGDWRHVARVEEAAVLEQVGAVGLERVARQPALELQVRQEIEHQVLERPGVGGLEDGCHCSPCSADEPGSLAGASRLSGYGCSNARSQSSAMSVLASR